MDKCLFQNEPYFTFSGGVLCTQFNSCYKIGQTWALCQVVNEDMCNSSYLISNSSLISGKSRPTTCQGLPLYPPPAAERWTLYTSLRIVRGINVEVTGEHKTIASLNLQLHFKCMQCRSREVRKNFVFQLGELHIAFAIPKVMEKIHRREWPW